MKRRRVCLMDQRTEVSEFSKQAPPFDLTVTVQSIQSSEVPGMEFIIKVRVGSCFHFLGTNSSGEIPHYASKAHAENIARAELTTLSKYYQLSVPDCFAGVAV